MTTTNGNGHAPAYARPVAAELVRPSQNRQAQQRPSQQSGYDWLGAVLRRKEILLFTIPLAAILGYVFYTRQPKVYASNLKLMIWTHLPPKIVNGETVAAPSVSLGKHINLLTSELVLTKAVDAGELKALKTFAGNSYPMGQLRSMFSVGPVDGAEDTLSLQVKGAEPSELPEILTGIVAAYQEILNEDAAAINKSSVELIEKLQVQVSSEKKTAEARYHELMQKLSIAPDPQTGRYINPHADHLSELNLSRSTLERELRQAQERIDNIGELQKMPFDKRSELLKVVAIEAVKYLQFNENTSSNVNSPANEQADLLEKLDRRISSLEESINQSELKLMSYRRSYGDRHPNVSELAAKIQFSETQLGTLREQKLRVQQDIVQVAASNKTEDSDPENSIPSAARLTRFDRDVITIYLAALNREVNRLSNNLTTLQAEIDQVQLAAETVRPEVEELNILASSIQEKDLMIRDIIDRMSGIALVASNHVTTKVRVVDSPGYGYQIEPKLLQIMMVSLFMGGMVGVGLIVLLDMSDLSYRSPAEIQERLQLPVIARIPKMATTTKAGKKGELADGLVTVTKPKSPVSEAYRTCRTTMLFRSKQEDLKTYLITSASAGDGKSTSACNVAMSLAQGGFDTVLMDIDLRRPRCHIYMGEDERPGLRQFAEGKATLEAVVRKSHLHDNLHFVAAGGAMSSPTEFLESPQFADLLMKLRDKHDFVIIDSPPVLPVADALALGKLADAVMLVMKIRKGVVLSSEKAVEMLRSIDANVQGVIVNSVDRGSHYSDYGKYGYKGYGGYNYYAQRYYGRQNDKYYESEEQPKSGS